MYRIPLTEQQHSLLANALAVAARSYDENVTEFRRMKPQLEAAEAANPERMSFIHSSACDGLAEQFEIQARDTRALLELVDEAEEV